MRRLPFLTEAETQADLDTRRRTRLADDRLTRITGPIRAVGILMVVFTLIVSFYHSLHPIAQSFCDEGDMEFCCPIEEQHWGMCDHDPDLGPCVQYTCFWSSIECVHDSTYSCCPIVPE